MTKIDASLEEKKRRMEELVKLLNEAGRAYYQEAREIMSNYEYDRLYDELVALEDKLHTTLAASPTVHVGYEVVSELPKERHERPMLSLDKTKEVERLKEFLGDQKALISWKMDGLTIVLTYRDGALYKAVTRGNGEIGEVVTNNAKVFRNIPLKISYQGELILRGEAVIRYDDFEKINEEIEDVDAKYKNPRNLCSGSVRQLNNEITARRNVHFYAFSLVRAEGVDFENSRARQMEWLKEQGFETVEYHLVTAKSVEEEVAWFAGQVQKNEVPSDGLVLVYDDIAYGESLGSTAKFPRDSFAFKWADEIRETTLKEIEWSPSRTGLINPVAIFDPVELEGTTVSRSQCPQYQYYGGAGAWCGRHDPGVQGQYDYSADCGKSDKKRGEGCTGILPGLRWQDQGPADFKCQGTLLHESAVSGQTDQGVHPLCEPGRHEY